MTTNQPPNAAALVWRYREAARALAGAEAALTACIEAHGGPLVMNGWCYSVETDDVSTYPVEAVDRWAFGLAVNGYGPYAEQLRALKHEGAVRRLKATKEKN